MLNYSIHSQSDERKKYVGSGAGRHHDENSPRGGTPWSWEAVPPFDGRQRGEREGPETYVSGPGRSLRFGCQSSGGDILLREARTPTK